uniref:Uncharacterized protein n=1 Tax=Botryococcus braunii Showa TaxID=1202541 RepID=A0A167RLV0_BOTBR|nr:hypothetical protein [Botryococcus braunii Showa]
MTTPYLSYRVRNSFRVRSSPWIPSEKASFSSSSTLLCPLPLAALAAPFGGYASLLRSGDLRGGLSVGVPCRGRKLRETFNDLKVRIVYQYSFHERPATGNTFPILPMKKPTAKERLRRFLAESKKTILLPPPPLLTLTPRGGQGLGIAFLKISSSLEWEHSLVMEVFKHRMGVAKHKLPFKISTIREAVTPCGLGKYLFHLHQQFSKLGP